MKHLCAAISLAFTVAILGSTPANAQPAEAPEAQVFQIARLIDGRADVVRQDQRMVVRNERIIALGSADQIALEDGVELVDLGDVTVIPGLINSHVHLAGPPDRAYAEALMRRSLYGGVTAVRSMGDDLRALPDLARAALLGDIAGPDIGYVAFFAGPGFFNDGRLQASSRGLVAGQIPWMLQINPETDLHEAVTMARGAGISGIKIYANLEGPRAAQIIAAAHAQGLPAWAHGAVFPATPAELVAAGADSLSHICMLAYQAQSMPRQYHDRADVDESLFADGLPDSVSELFAQMAEAGTVLDATVYVYETIERMRAQLPPGKGPPIYCSAELSRRLVAEAHRAGVAISVGTDAPAPLDQAFPAVLREMQILLEDAGMSPLEVLRAASWNGARSLGWEDQMGSLEVGKLANFVVLRKDPQADLIAALESVERVVKRGRSYRREEYSADELAKLRQ